MSGFTAAISRTACRRGCTTIPVKWPSFILTATYTARPRPCSSLIAPRVTSGTVVLFDEYFNYANWEQHQFKAFQEFVQEHDVKYAYLGFARQQVAVRIISIGAARRRAMTALFSADVNMTPAAERLHERRRWPAPGQRATLDLTVFISCYNEEEYIVPTIQTVRDALNEIGTISL